VPNPTESRPADDLSVVPAAVPSVPSSSVPSSSVLTSSVLPSAPPSARLPVKPFPAGSRVLHIGAPKTGTTSIQAAQGQLLDVKDEHGCPVHVPGTPLEQARAALAVLDRSTGWLQDYKPVPGKYWERLVGRVREAPGTVFFSSEYLCEADRPTIRRIVDELADGDVRVVLTLRPLARILPSAWQQYLKSGHELPYQRWLKAVLADPPKTSVTPSFWPRHDQGAVIDRWVSEIGADRLTVIILDPDDHGLLLRSFDSLLALPPGTLADLPAGQQNRSMTAAEAELFRQVNIALRRNRLPYDDYAHLIRYGAIMRSVERARPGPDAARLITPGWALQRAIELGTGYGERIEALRADGLTVIGDPMQLRDAPVAPDPADRAPAAPDLIQVSVAVEALLGAVSRSVNGKAFFPDEVEIDPTASTPGMPGGGRSPARAIPAGELTFRELSGVMGSHVRRAVRRRARRARAALSDLPRRDQASD
jgi:hypothetical protein